MQYFWGFLYYQDKPPFVSGFFVEIRRRMGNEVFDVFEKAIFDKLEASRQKKAAPASAAGTGWNEEAPGSGAAGRREEKGSMQKTEVTPVESSGKHQGKLVIDATVANQDIKYPMNLGLLNKAREISEQLIDELPRQSIGKNHGRIESRRENAI